MNESFTLIQAKQDLIRRLSGKFPDVMVYEGFCRNQEYRTGDQARLSVMIQSVNASPIGFGDYLGGSTEANMYRENFGIMTESTFSFLLLFPPSFGEEKAAELFLRLCSSLAFWDEYDFTRMSCEEITFSEEAQCFQMKMHADASMMLTGSEENPLVSGVKVKGTAT